MPDVVLIGLESCGKSALFRGLTGFATPDESNVRGSTVFVKRANVRVGGQNVQLKDVPGVRISSDSEATATALEALGSADTVLLVARATHAAGELEALFGGLAAKLSGRKLALVLTFIDRAVNSARIAAHFRQRLGIPVAAVNAREMDTGARREVLTAIAAATEADLSTASTTSNDQFASVQPQTTVFEHPVAGPLMAVLCMVAMFVLPIVGAYWFSDAAQGLINAWFMNDLKLAFGSALQGHELILNLVAGDFGLITLGIYSFVWAFPVVVLIGVSVALVEEIGLHDRITSALDPWLRHIGMSGRDLSPVITGFGCNVVAVQRTRSCSACTRRACVTMISLGSACSYQIGASLSLFGSAGQIHLFAPYLAALFFVGALHTRLWHPVLTATQARPIAERAFLQVPSPRAVMWRVKSVLGQFFRQAMPIFLLVCIVATLLQAAGVIGAMATALGPTLERLFGLPGEVGPGIIVSMLRKDGVLVLNQNDGALLRSLSAGQLFTLIWLCSTLTACMVTLLAVTRELGLRAALGIACRQMITSLVSTALIARIA